jgi:branched-chain amino acid transport system ATP-binding protein
VTAAVSLAALTVQFGAVRAVDGVDLDIEPGTITGFIGPNGAGKTTVLDAISGLVATTGSVAINGVDVTGMTPARRARLGLGRSFQDGRLFPGLTVREALAIGLGRHMDQLGYLPVVLGLGRKQERETAGRVEDLADSFGLNGYLDAYLNELSTGTRRIVDIAAVVAHQPSVLLLDEPSSGIAQRESEALGPLIKRTRDELDCTILLVEHDMPLITSVSDELVAFETGRVIARGAPHDVVNDPAVVEAYLGTDERVIKRSGAAAGAATTRTRRPRRQRERA